MISIFAKQSLSAAGHLLKSLRVSGSLHFNLRRYIVDVMQIFGRDGRAMQALHGGGQRVVVDPAARAFFRALQRFTATVQPSSCSTVRADASATFFSPGTMHRCGSAATVSVAVAALLAVFGSVDP